MNISTIAHKDCTGCGACHAVCPVKAIKLQQGEDGFLYPYVTNEQCIQCNKCLNICHTKKDNCIWDNGIILAGHYEDKKALASSSSGGAASAIADYTISNGGCVYGVVYKRGFKGAEYFCAERINEIERFKGSKYIQADPPDYKGIKSKLEDGEIITFFGLPCQVDALYYYLGKKYDNLLLVSLVCHGPTSTKVMEKYIEEIEEPSNHVKEFRLRYKKNGFTRPSRIYVRRKSGKEEIIPFITSSFGMAFELLNRESCSSCKSKYPNGVADIIIGDFWGGKDKDSKQSEYGESLIIVRNPQKLNIINRLKEVGFSIEEAEWDGLEKKNPALFKSSNRKLKRDQFVDYLQLHTLREAVNHNTTKKERIINYIYYWTRVLIPNNIWRRLRK